MVAWSGGRDSTHLLYRLVATHGLRCIAVFGLTPFTPPEIVENVERISGKLGVRLVKIASAKNHIEVARFCIADYASSRQPILVNLACASCKYVNKEVFRVASKLGASTVVYGGNRFEHVHNGPASIKVNRKDRYSFSSMLIDNGLRLVAGAKHLAANPKMIRYLWTFFSASLLYTNQYTIFLRLRYPRIRRFDYYHFAEWKLDEVESTLQKLQWTLPSGCNSTWRADCEFEAFKNTAFREQLGFTYAQSFYGNIIRSGGMKREEALARLEKEGVSEERLETVLKKCGLESDPRTEWLRVKS